MSTHAQDEALRADIEATLLAAADVEDHELDEQDRKELAALVGALMGVFARHRHPAVWHAASVRGVASNVLASLLDGGVPASRRAVETALAAAGITEGAVR